VLAKGSTSAATVTTDLETKVTTVVNGDAEYDARTTRRAVNLLLAESNVKAKVSLEQDVQTPIGSGFGASAASATSAVYATAAAAGIRKEKAELALFAHRAEILEQTGLGTVSVIFDGVGAGAITIPGEPGKAKFITVDVPRDVRLVTAFVAPYDKRDALSSATVSERINILGHASLLSFLSDPTLDTLANEGEKFSAALGLESTEVKKLIRFAKAAGANYASQNMIGYSVHSLVGVQEADRVVRALQNYSRQIRVDVFEVGSTRAGVVEASRRSRVPS
jgi:pantoate kinase